MQRVRSEVGTGMKIGTSLRKHPDPDYWEKRSQKGLFRQLGHMRLVWDKTAEYYRCKNCETLLTVHRSSKFETDRGCAEMMVRYYKDGRWVDGKLRCRDIVIEELI